MMKMFGSADSDGQMPLMMTSQDDKSGLSTYKATQIVTWQNSRHFATPPLVSLRNDVRETSAEIPYWWRVTSQAWVVGLICWKFVPANQKHYPDLGGTGHQYGIYSLVYQTSFRWETSSGFAKCRLFFSGYSNCLKWETVWWSLVMLKLLANCLSILLLQECSRITVFFCRSTPCSVQCVLWDKSSRWQVWPESYSLFTASQSYLWCSK